MRYLRQNTATLVHIGPGVTASDSITLLTSLTITTNKAELYKAGATAAVDISSNTWTHLTSGIYSIALTASNLDTLGPLTMHFHPALAKPILVEATVLSQTAFDALCGGGVLPADVTKLNGNATAAVNLGLGAQGIVPLIVGNGSSTTRVATDLTVAVSSHYTGRTLIFMTGTLAYQATSITGYNGTTKELTVAALTAAPASADTAIII